MYIEYVGWVALRCVLIPQSLSETSSCARLSGRSGSGGVELNLSEGKAKRAEGRLEWWGIWYKCDRMKIPTVSYHGLWQDTKFRFNNVVAG